MRPLLRSASALLLLSAAPALAQDARQHRVEPGETLNGIANRAGVDREAIIEANALKPPYLIRAGQSLKIPAKGARRTIAARAPASRGSAGPGDYVVKPGDTLGGIANRESVPRILIAEANRLEPPYTLRVGQRLLIPRTRHHVVASGETGFAIAMDYGVPWSQIAVANGLSENDALPVGKRLLIPTVLAAPSAAPQPAAAVSSSSSSFAWPLRGNLRRKFSGREEDGAYHDGIDILADKGEAVRAARAGTVIFAADEPKQFGKLVIVDHGGGWHSIYGSLDRITVKKGERIAQGERLGLVGDTSITRKTELHFELRRDGKPVDPLSELP